METGSVTLKRWQGLTVAFALLALAVLMCLRAWVSEDAYITFRVIDNFMNGYGLRWNIHERVQVYTHPLWMLLHIPFYAVWRNPFVISIGLGVACSLAAIWIARRTFDKPPLTATLGLLLPLLLSRIFIDFTTSGLENSLSYLLFAVFGYLLLRQRQHPRFWLYCSLTVALALLTRLDNAVLYAPPLIYLVCSQWCSTRWRQVALGALPLILWAAFALFYYGFFFPNTKYAKLNTGIDFTAYAMQGMIYFIELFSSDAFSLMLLAIGFVLIVEYAKDSRKGLPNASLLLSMNLGVLAYIGYVIAIGGDFMSGRFWTLPLFATVWLIYAYIPVIGERRAVVVAAFLVILKLLSLNIAKDSLATCDRDESGQLFSALGYCIKQGIVDERQFFFPYVALFDGQEFSLTRWESHENTLAAGEARRTPQEISLNHMVGVFGYYVGPEVAIIDDYAITDPLLARLPLANPSHWRIGHFYRAIPKGYLEAARTGDARQMHPSLAGYWQPLRLITQGDLWNLNRLQAIVDFNLGRYDHYKQDYLAAQHP